ncbi:MAG: YfhO family protein [Mangrovibacterium sp.]
MTTSRKHLILSIAAIIVFFIALALVYFAPQLQKQKLNASDNTTWMGMSQEIRHFKEQTGEQTLWTNSMFGGMPAYLISITYPGELLGKLQATYFAVVPAPAGYIALGFICFFIMCLLLRINRWTAIIGSLMWAMGSYFFILIDAGHNTKVHTLMYIPLVVGGVIAAFKSRAFVGAVVTALGLSLMLTANHPQMTYYTGLMVIFIVVAYGIDAFQQKTIPAFAKSAALLLVAALLAVGTNYARLSTTLEYGKYSTRGKSELQVDQNNQTSGLDKNYILEYSYDLGESITSFIPRFKGGGMAEPVGEKSASYELLAASQGKAQARKAIQALPLYWGSQPISTAPFYFGAVVFFFFVLGLFVVKGKNKWWILGIVAFTFLLSLGKNFLLLNDFMIDYFPGYNKFRDVKNVVFIQHFAIVFMGVLAMREIVLGSLSESKLNQSLIYSWGILGGFCALFILMPSLAGNFRSPMDARYPQQLVDAFMSDRQSMLRADAFRSLAFVSLAAGISWLFINKKLKASYTIVGLALVVLIDLWSFDKKYLNNDDFISAHRAENPYTPSTADKYILQDSDPDFRVLNLTVSPFNDSSTSYFHKSIGGYHGAKMERYQELYSHGMSQEMQRIVGGFQTPDSLDCIIQSASILNMLNTRYLIYSPQAEPIINSHALGNAWFVSSFETVPDANREIAAIQSFDPESEAIVDERFASLLKGVNPSSGRTSDIALTSYAPNHLQYTADVHGGTSLAVFSEIYYPAGWNAYIDGNIVDHLRANYVLRALPIPEGKHQIEFKFEPQSYAVGNRISFICSLLIIMGVLAAIYISAKKKEDNEEYEND